MGSVFHNLYLNTVGLKLPTATMATKQRKALLLIQIQIRLYGHGEYFFIISRNVLSFTFSADNVLVTSCIKFLPV